MPEDKTELIQQLYQLTEQLHSQVHNLNPDMEHNDPEQVEAVNQLITDRGALIQELDQVISVLPTWSTAEQKLILQIREWEERNQKKLKMLYQSFSSQFQKLQQGKRLTNHYLGSYEPVYTDGAYIDKKK